MSLPAGQSSGRGRAALSKANPPRVEIAERYAEATRGLPDVPDEFPPKRRTALAKVSAKRLAEIGDVPFSTFRPPSGDIGGLGANGGSTLKRSRGNRTKARNKDAAGEWRAAVLALWFPGWSDDECGVPCPVSGADLRAGWHPHHILERKVLWSHGLAARVVEVMDRHTGELVAAPAMYHPFIGMPVAPAVNLGFESGVVEIPRHLIPQRMWDLAAVLDGLDPLAGPQWATAKLEADYR